MIQLAPENNIKPWRGHIPYHRARRWISIHDDGEMPLPLEVFITQSAYLRVCSHAGSDLDHETGGWLLGKWREDAACGRQFIVIEKILPAPYTRRGKVYLTFTQDTQVAMHNTLDQDYPGKTLLGWYHTHPGMGVFLSHYDLWLHEHFFPAPWQVALVIEPQMKMGGFFIPGMDGCMDPLRYSGFHELINHSRHSVVHWTNLLNHAGVLGHGLASINRWRWSG
jgi:proteasome lid subunit RPN8/RPN11